MTPLNSISYVMADERTADLKFTEQGNNTLISVDFDAEQMNPEEMQREGWQAILDSFKNHVEK